MSPRHEPDQRVRVLLIDDNPDQAVIVRRVLQRAGAYDLAHAPTGEAGLEQAAARPPDVILCDYRLPGMSGVQVLKTLRARGNETPFVIVTSAGSERVAVEAMQEGAHDYLVKDAAYEDLLPRIIQRSLDRFEDQRLRQRLEAEREEARRELELAYTELHSMQQQLIQAAKLESVGRLAAGAAHEVKNPLAILLMGVEFLTARLASSADEPVQLTLTSMKDAVTRADGVIRGLLDFASHKLLEPTPMLLQAVIEQAVRLVKHEVDTRHHQVCVEMDLHVPLLLLDATKLEQVFINLFMNAMHAMRTPGTLTVRTRQEAAAGDVWCAPGRFAPGAKLVIVEVDDTGHGIPEPALGKIFDPFFTTKPTGQGTGLGLAITKTIIELHGGAIDIRNRPDGGVRASLAFPLSPDDAITRPSQ